MAKARTQRRGASIQRGAAGGIARFPFSGDDATGVQDGPAVKVELEQHFEPIRVAVQAREARFGAKLTDDTVQIDSQSDMD